MRDRVNTPANEIWTSGPTHRKKKKTRKARERRKRNTRIPGRLPALCRARPLRLTLLVDFFIHPLRRLPPIPRLLVYIPSGINDVLDELLGLLRVFLPLSLLRSLIPIVRTPRLPTLWPTRATLVLHRHRHKVHQKLCWRTRVYPTRQGEHCTEDDAPLHEPKREHHGAVEARKREVHAEDRE